MDAQNSLDLAKRATRDSNTMKTLAVLGMLYLPTTLISSIFSTVFFNVESNQQGLQTFKVVWVLVVTAVILTLATFALWTWLSDVEILTVAGKVLEGVRKRWQGLRRLVHSLRWGISLNIV